MASLIIAGAALLAGGTAARIGLRSMAKSGTVLSPFFAAVAGQKAVSDQWLKGGFQGRMDRKEAVEILGLKCVAFRTVVSSQLLTRSLSQGIAHDPHPFERCAPSDHARVRSLSRTAFSPLIRFS